MINFENMLKKEEPIKNTTVKVEIKSSEQKKEVSLEDLFEKAIEKTEKREVGCSFLIKDAKGYLREIETTYRKDGVIDGAGVARYERVLEALLKAKLTTEEIKEILAQTNFYSDLDNRSDLDLYKIESILEKYQFHLENIFPDRGKNKNQNPEIERKKIEGIDTQELEREIKKSDIIKLSEKEIEKEKSSFGETDPIIEAQINLNKTRKEKDVWARCGDYIFLLKNLFEAGLKFGQIKEILAEIGFKESVENYLNQVEKGSLKGHNKELLEKILGKYGESINSLFSNFPEATGKIEIPEQLKDRKCPTIAAIPDNLDKIEPEDIEKQPLLKAQKYLDKIYLKMQKLKNYHSEGRFHYDSVLDNLFKAGLKLPKIKEILNETTFFYVLREEMRNHDFARKLFKRAIEKILSENGHKLEDLLPDDFYDRPKTKQPDDNKQ